MKICKVERFLGTSHLISIFYSVSIDFKLELPIIKFICWRGAVQTFVSSNMDIYILPPFQSVCLLHFSNALYIFFLMYWNVHFYTFPVDIWMDIQTFQSYCMTQHNIQLLYQRQIELRNLCNIINVHDCGRGGRRFYSDIDISVDQCHRAISGEEDVTCLQILKFWETNFQFCAKNILFLPFPSILIISTLPRMNR